MPINPTNTIDPTVMTKNWTAGLQSASNAAKLAYKYQNPKAAFNANPTQSEASLVAGIQRMANAHKYANAMAKVDLNQAAQNMVNYGVANWQAAGANKAYKFAAVAANLATAISSVKAQVAAMPRGRGQANQARMLAWFNGMSAYYGKIKV